MKRWSGWADGRRRSSLHDHIYIVKRVCLGRSGETPEAGQGPLARVLLLTGGVHAHAIGDGRSRGRLSGGADRDRAANERQGGDKDGGRVHSRLVANKSKELAGHGDHTLTDFCRHAAGYWADHLPAPA